MEEEGEGVAAAKHVDSDRMLWNALQNEVGAQVGRNAAATWERRGLAVSLLRAASFLLSGQCCRKMSPSYLLDAVSANLR